MAETLINGNIQWYNLGNIIIMQLFQNTTNTLTITSVTNGMNGFKYRVKLNKNSCGLNSTETTVYPLMC
jgi:hypothetical protein